MVAMKKGESMKSKIFLVLLTLISVSGLAYGNVTCENPATGAQLSIENARGGVAVLSLNDKLILSLKQQMRGSSVLSIIPGQITYGAHRIQFSGELNPDNRVEVNGNQTGLNFRIYSTQGEILSSFNFNSGECDI